MLGTVTEFDLVRGCGVIHCGDLKIDVPLCVSHAKEQNYLEVGDVVSFTGCGGQNGPEARDIILLWRGGIEKATSNASSVEATITRHSEKVIATDIRSMQSQTAKLTIQQTKMEIFSKQPDGRDQCANCRKLMTPTLALANGVPHRSFCPFCGEIHRDFTKPRIPTIKERAAGAAATGVIGLIVSGLFGL